MTQIDARSTTIDASEPVRARTSASARLANVIVDPRAAFAGVAEPSPWGLAVMAMVALRFGSLFLFYRPQITVAKLLAGLAFQLASVMPVLLMLAAVLWAVALAVGSHVPWSTALGITAHVLFAYTLATVVAASVAGAVLPASVDVDLRNPPFTNLGPLAPDNALARTVMGFVDVRAAYATVLMWVSIRSAMARATRARTLLVVAAWAGSVVAFRVVVTVLRS